MQLRHENKYCISLVDMLSLKMSLSAVMHLDEHTIDGKYEITSLYLDTADDKALLENIAGVPNREKYRIRYYNDDINHIFLEKKCKQGELGFKEQTVMAKEDVVKILNGDYSSIATSSDPLIKEVYEKIFFENLHPSSVVKYQRIPYIYEAGNVRVTMDYDIRTTVSVEDFLDVDAPTIPVDDACNLLEVKWDQYLPDIIAQIVNLDNLSQIPYSKYVHSRMYE